MMAMFVTLLRHLSPAMGRYAAGHRRGRRQHHQASIRIDEDPKKQFRILQRMKRRPAGKEKKKILSGISWNQLRRAAEARNAVCHRDRAMLLSRWQKYYAAWISLAEAMGDRTAARKIKRDFSKLQKSIANRPFGRVV